MSLPMKIKIDTREQIAGIAELFSSRGFITEEAKLQIGDFIVEDLVIERKTVKDFQRSLVDGRLFSKYAE